MDQSATIAAPTVQCPRCTATASVLERYCPTCGTQLLTARAADGFAPATRRAAPKTTNPLKRILAPLAPVAYLLVKFKFLLLTLFKFKIGLLFLSMAVSVWAYAAAWGLGVPAAIGFVALILIHELGHWVAFRYKKIPVGLPVFVPFIGAFVAAKAPVASPVDMGDIALAGPIAGTAASFACLGLGNVLGGPFWPYLGLLGLYMNLFNLIPIGFLDGGRIAKVVTLWLWVPGLALLGYLFLQHQNPLLLSVAVLGLWELVSRFRQRGRQPVQPSASQAVRWQDRLVLGGCYFALVALIALTMLHNPAFGWGTL